MTPRPYINILTILLCLTSVLTSCEHSSDNKNKVRNRIKSINNHLLDTSTTAIIAFEKGGYPFDNASQRTELSEDEINDIDSLLVECVTDYNKGHKGLQIDLHGRNYKKQLVPATNKNGEKEVWVNCFCEASDNRWKNNIRIIADGGNCFFNFKINLTTKKYFDLRVNGKA